MSDPMRCDECNGNVTGERVLCSGCHVALMVMDTDAVVGPLRLALAEATRERSLLHERVCELVSLLQTAERDRDEARALAASWEREFNVANHERLRLWDEAESFCEKLDQFEANGFPNVASVMDRIAVLSRARETDGAIREAKERLWDALDRESLGGTYLAARGLRAALSSPPRPGAEAPITCEEVGCPTCCPSPSAETKDDDKGGAA